MVLDCINNRSNTTDTKQPTTTTAEFTGLLRNFADHICTTRIVPDIAIAGMDKNNVVTTTCSATHHRSGAREYILYSSRVGNPGKTIVARRADSFMIFAADH